MLCIWMGLPSTFGTVPIFFVDRHKILFKVSSHLSSSVNWLSWPTTFFFVEKGKKERPLYSSVQSQVWL